MIMLKSGGDTLILSHNTNGTYSMFKIQEFSDRYVSPPPVSKCQTSLFHTSSIFDLSLQLGELEQR